MEKMQEFIDFIFHEVWCKAPTSGKFKLELFDGNADLREVMEAFFYSDASGAYFFYSHIQRIYHFFANLAPAQIVHFQHWYQGNNDLEKICANDPDTQLVRYIDMAVSYKDLSEHLASFFKGLYSPALLNLAVLKAKIGEIEDHYRAFTKANKSGKCPFCGMSDLQGEYHSTREAYDHYLPKTLYPFNSINFRNLVPACHHCNSSYKTSKDPAFTPKDPARATHRRKLFYPYASTTHSIELRVKLMHSDVDKLTPADVELKFGPPALMEEIETWTDVYGIEERYKAKFCAENDGKYWLTQILDEWKEDGRSPTDLLTTLARQAKGYPYAECNFLKKSFLDACRQAGVF